MKFSGPRCGSGKPKRKRKPSSVRRSLEYPCVSRLRRRRLLAFLSRHGFSSTFQALLQETAVFFSVEHLERLARQGQWDDAIKYVVRFVPKVDAMLGEEGRLLFSFINLHRTIHSISIGTPHGALMTEFYERDLSKYPNAPSGAVRRTRLLSALHRNEKLRAVIDWQLERDRAAEIVKDLIAKTPEFSDLLRLPNCRDNPHNILPIRSCSSSHRRRHRKEGGRIPASDLTKTYLRKKRSLLLSSSHFEESSLGLSCKGSALLADIIDESVKAGMCRVVQDGHPFEDSCNEAIRKRKRESSASCNLGVMEVSSSTRHKRVRRSPEYPCVSRLRHRRLLAFLQHRGFHSTFKAFVQETNVFFSIAHLKHLVFLGQWDEAINYVYRFAPSAEMLGDVGNVLLNFLHTLKVLNCMATASPCGVLLVELEHCFSSLRKYPNSHLDAVRLNKMFLAMHRSKELRASISWHHVRYKAAEIVKDLIAKTPEFNDLLRLPDCRDRPHDILPIGSCSHRRHHIKEKGEFQLLNLPDSTFRRRGACHLQVNARELL
ncbi:unnamed protein product [Triticum aestivum]|uniref:Uncharacterized protein n=1 Tax=Triticum aestivum TaxID=4565 RepID=A0A7H4LLR7_WHEAT|nr:unnamed protein product [Triticum aestivum]